MRGNRIFGFNVRVIVNDILRSLGIVTLSGLLSAVGTPGVQAAAHEGCANYGTETNSAETVSSQPTRTLRFEVEDYAQLCRFEELHLSPDGDFAVFATRPLLKESSEERKVFILATTEGAKPLQLDLPATAREIRWAGDSQLLAFLADDRDVTRVYIYNWKTRALSRISDNTDSVTAFELSNSGKQLAYVTRQKWIEPATLYNRMRQAGPGIAIDPDTVSMNEIIDPNFAKRLHQSDSTLWVADIGKTSRRIEVPGDLWLTSELHWSDDDSMISVVYVADSVPQLSTRPFRTSLGIVSVDSGKFYDIAVAFDSTSMSFGQSFRGGDWLPGQHRLVLRRTTMRDPRTDWDYPEWTIATPDPLEAQPNLRWYPVEGVWDVKIHPVTAHLLLVENTLEAVSSLYEWSDTGVRRSDIVSRMDGGSSEFSIARHANAMVFVNESLVRPPEIYLYRKGFRGGKIRRLSSINQQISAKITATLSAVSWAGADGTMVRGWLLEPSPTWPKPWPVVTFLHGGPGAPITNRFAPYWNAWPYPFDVYASNGIGVFFPNYRGSATFGAAFQKPKQLDAEPIDDVTTGVQFLVNSGIADKSRLGLSGHSHGAWLGPMVLTRSPVFRASSFAEGWGNTVEAYELLPGKHLREIVDPMSGGSLYKVPEALARYLEESPDLHFGKVTSANLFESGSEAGVLEMLGLGKASMANGLPTESIVYPLTGHNPTSPEVQRDSAQRNADWFMFWLRDKERDSAGSATQYERWRKFKSEWLLRSGRSQNGSSVQ